jgi:hypothetical protein
MCLATPRIAAGSVRDQLRRRVTGSAGTDINAPILGDGRPCPTEP